MRDSKPILALESTIIAHGMPYPQNLETALKLEAIALENGAIPATICIHDGKIHIGCERELLEHLSTSNQVMKAGVRDIPHAIASGKTAATTVSGTLHCAHLAGIHVFATGGIGGVHRGADRTFDISADLIQLGRTPMITVSAGAKAILDIPATLEYLETLGVMPYGYRTDTFPLFYSHHSEYPIQRLDSVRDIAERYNVLKKIDVGRGMLICNPVPIETQIPYEEIKQIIDKALYENRHLTGPKITPALLQAIAIKTGGRSLVTNMALVGSNVRLGAQISKEINRIHGEMGVTNE